MTTSKSPSTARRTWIVFGLVIGVLLAFRLCLGFFVQPPINALPEGNVMLYWRLGLDIPFIASAEGVLEAQGEPSGPLAQAFLLAGLSEELGDRQILNLAYSENWRVMAQP